jgi:hypothetical protein
MTEKQRAPRGHESTRFRKTAESAEDTEEMRLIPVGILCVLCVLCGSRDGKKI